MPATFPIKSTVRRNCTCPLVLPVWSVNALGINVQPICGWKFLFTTWATVKMLFQCLAPNVGKMRSPLSLAPYAYRTSNALFLIHGPYYVEIIASKGSEHVLEPVKIMAETFIRNTPAEAATVNETALFPEEKLVKDSIVLISSDAFGYDGFKKIYTAEYEFDDHSLMAYLSHRGTPAEAKELASNYAKFLLAFGGQNIEAQLSIKDARLIKILDTYEIVFSHDSYLAGIREAATINQAKMLAIRLYNRINEGGNESRSEQ